LSSKSRAIAAHSAFSALVAAGTPARRYRNSKAYCAG
jgi:hypothetical protein